MPRPPLSAPIGSSPINTRRGFIDRGRLSGWPIGADTLLARNKDERAAPRRQAVIHG